MYERLCANVKVNQAEILRFIGQLFIHWLYFIYALKFYSGIHVKITRRWKSTLTPFCYVCEAVPGSLFWAFNGLNQLPKVRFEFLFNLIGKSTVTFLTGQSWRVLKSRYTSGDPEQGFRRCFADELNQSLVSSVAQATTSRRERDICYSCREVLYHLGGGKGYHYFCFRAFTILRVLRGVDPKSKIQMNLVL